MEKTEVTVLATVDRSHSWANPQDLHCSEDPVLRIRSALVCLMGDYVRRVPDQPVRTEISPQVAPRMSKVR